MNYLNTVISFVEAPPKKSKIFQIFQLELRLKWLISKKNYKVMGDLDKIFVKILETDTDFIIYKPSTMS